MAVVTEECDVCQGRGFTKIACCEWCGSYDVRTCEMCDGTGEDIYDDEPLATDRWTIGYMFPQITVRRGGISYAQPHPRHEPAYASLEDRIDLWGEV